MAEQPSQDGDCRCRWKSAISWAAQLLVAVILGQTLFFKLTYAPETRAIFADLGGRPAATATAIFELIAVVLLLMPRSAWAGAALALLLMIGAIGSHLTVLGIAVTDPATGQSDAGLLFAMALTVTAASAIVLWLRRNEIPGIGRQQRLARP